MRRLRDLGRRHLVDRPVRSALVGLSIALGVAVLLGVTAGAATMRAGLDRISGTLGGRADVVISSAGPFGSRLPEDTADRIAADEDVAAVAAIRATVATSSAADRAIAGYTTAVVAADPAGFELLSAVVTEGRLPAVDGEVAVDRGQAEDLALALGDEITLSPEVSGQVVGYLERGALTNAAGGEVVLGLPSLADALVVPLAPVQVVATLDDGVDVASWIDGHRSLVPEARLEDADALRNPLEELFDGIIGALGALSTIALLLAGYLIHLALTSSVAQRVRTYGTLLALGATRRQIAGTVVAEVLWLAVVAVAVGLALGLLLARFLAAAVAEIFGTPDAGLVVHLPDVVACGAAGLACAAISSLVPARNAVRLAPAAAMNGDAPAVRPSRTVAAVGVSMLVASAALLTLGPDVLGPMGTGLTLLGIGFVLPTLLPHLAALLSPAVRWASPGVGEVGVAHVVKERSRSALTAGLLVAVLGITLLAGTGYRTMAPDFRDYMRLQFGSDVQVHTGFRLTGNALPVGYDEQVRTVSDVAAVTPMWHTRTDVEGVDGDRILTVIDPATHFGPAGYLFVDGDLDAARSGLDHGGVLVSYGLATQQGWSVGEPVELAVGSQPVAFTIAATYSSFGDDYSRAFVIGRADAEQRLGLTLGGPTEIRIDVADDVDPHAVAGRLPPIEGPSPLRFSFGDDNVDEAVQQFDSVFGLFIVVQALGAVIGLLGIANTMAISVLERRREIGILRALGTRIGEVRRMVFVEVLVLVAIALVVAVAMSWLLARDIGGSGGAMFGFRADPRYPWAWVPVLAVLAAVAAVGASIVPARRASHVDPCEALRLD